jgi:diketogulonate reductase-like aldo/keto reductase
MLDQEIVVLPKAAQPIHMTANLNIFDFRLSEKEHATIASMNKNQHTDWDPTSVP